LYTRPPEPGGVRAPAGVPVEFHLHPSAPHEFDLIAFNTTAARHANADINDRRSLLAA